MERVDMRRAPRSLKGEKGVRHGGLSYGAAFLHLSCRRASHTFPGLFLPGRFPVEQSVSLFTMPLAKGTKAPDFTLKTKTADGARDVRLSDNFGKKQTVLLFFPAAFSGVCTQEMCDQSSGLGEYEKLNATVYGISVDSPYAQEAWAKANAIKIPLLSDLNKTTARAYDVVLPNFAGIYEVAARAAFVIGTDGVVKYAEQTPTPKDLPNFAAVKKALE
jgi:glutaredoxin-dependent peroxiredoxin